ncbi:diguanylate cyclase domain-containing protein [Gordonia sp. NPDC058843]|uniref:diguanylate cyclase domain-containing protein n=1 Tax=Gordonia sp. NPDC058843 TaxID=3346648 RepID=UPI0036B29918
MYRPDLHLGTLRGPLPRSPLHVLRTYLAVTSLLYAIGVALTLFPVDDSATLSDPTGGLVAVVLGLTALGWLSVRPQRPLPAVIAACVATPAVMAFHELISAEFLCMVAAMFLAMYLRATLPRRRAWAFIGLLTLGCVVALAVAPAPKYLSTYIVVAVAIPAAAESFGLLTRTLLTAVCTDPLTGVFNRAGWELATTGLLDGRRSAAAVTVISLDIDDVATIYGTQGREAGDRQLAHHARTCVGLLPADTAMARVGDSEFAICLVHDDGGPPGQAATLIAELRRQLPSTSLGAATAPAPAANITALHAQAASRLASVRRDRARRSDQPDPQ